ncbi:MAG: double-cubane-cluster-containing anaerobic reductase [Planctomycetota bacterium]
MTADKSNKCNQENNPCQEKPQSPCQSKPNPCQPQPSPCQPKTSPCPTAVGCRSANTTHQQRAAPPPANTCATKNDPCRSNSVSPCSASKPPATGTGSCPMSYFDNMVGNCLAYAEEAKAAGKPVVGIFCEYTPREIIMAVGAVPVCMCGGSEATIPAAEEDLPASICPLIKSSYGYAKLRNNPFLEMSELLVAETTCDGKKKMYELLSKYKKMFILELPQKADDPDAFRHWKAEIVKLKEYLENQFNVKITDRKLKEAIKTMNEERRLRIRIAELAGNKVPLLSGMQVLGAKSLISGIPEDFKMYQKLISEIEAEDKRQPVQCTGRPRIMLTGVPMPHEAEKVMRVIEEAGGSVVAQESCSGLKPIDLPVNEDGDPLQAIAEKYFHLPCSVMTPNTRRLDFFDKLISQYKPQAVIDVVWQGCHTYNVESFLIQKYFEEKHHLPYLKLETDYSQSDSAQIKVRVQALLEIVKSKNY